MDVCCLTLIGILSAILVVLYRALRRKPSFVLKNKKILITGASSGLGKACALVLAKEGCNLILSSRHLEELKAVANEINGRSQGTASVDISLMPLDLGSAGSIQHTIGQLKLHHPDLYAVVHSAGQGFRGRCMDTSIQVHANIMQVNYLGAVELMTGALEIMTKNRSGHIIAVSSVQGLVSIPFRSSYSASKHALQAFCDSLRAEVSDKGIAVTVLSPGYIRTNFSLNAITAEGAKYDRMDKTTASGMEPVYVAQRLVECLKQPQDELILAPLYMHLVIILRHVFPSLFFWIMEKRSCRGM